MDYNYYEVMEALQLAQAREHIHRLIEAVGHMPGSRRASSGSGSGCNPDLRMSGDLLEMDDKGTAVLACGQARPQPQGPAGQGGEAAGRVVEEAVPQRPPRDEGLASLGAACAIAAKEVEAEWRAARLKAADALPVPAPAALSASESSSSSSSSSSYHDMSAQDWVDAGAEAALQPVQAAAGGGAGGLLLGWALRGPQPAAAGTLLTGTAGAGELQAWRQQQPWAGGDVHQDGQQSEDGCSSDEDGGWQLVAAEEREDVAGKGKDRG